MNSLKIAILIVIVSIVLSILFVAEYSTKQFPAKRGERWLLLIAHPDDETMFFSPTLLSLTSIGVNMYLLSITSGNSEGLGPIRIKELYSAASIYGILPDNVKFVDPEEHSYRDGFHQWNISELSTSIFAQIIQTKPIGIITFDEHGISGHPNHIGCYEAISNLKRKGKLKELGVREAVALESVGIWHKYIGFADLFLTVYLQMKGEAGSFLTYWTNPIRTYEAMACHHSQLRWFRYFYMALSRYIYVNTFVSIE